MTFPRAPRSRGHSQAVNTGCETPEPTEAKLRGVLGCMWTCWPCVPGGAFFCPRTVRTVPRKAWLWLCTDTQSPLMTPQFFSQACGLTLACGCPPSLSSLWLGLTHTGPPAALYPAFHSSLRLTSPRAPLCAWITLSLQLHPHACPLQAPGLSGYRPLHTYTYWSVKASLGPPDTRKPPTLALGTLCSPDRFLSLSPSRNSDFQEAL